MERKKSNGGDKNTELSRADAFIEKIIGHILSFIKNYPSSDAQDIVYNASGNLQGEL